MRMMLIDGLMVLAAWFTSISLNTVPPGTVAQYTKALSDEPDRGGHDGRNGNGHGYEGECRYGAILHNRTKES